MIKTKKINIRSLFLICDIQPQYYNHGAALLLIFIFRGATFYLYMQSPLTIAYKQELEKSFRQENAKREWKRLYNYHGYPALVIYEEGKTPYFLR